MSERKPTLMDLQHRRRIRGWQDEAQNEMEALRPADLQALEEMIKRELSRLTSYLKEEYGLREVATIIGPGEAQQQADVSATMMKRDRLQVRLRTCQEHIRKWAHGVHRPSFVPKKTVERARVAAEILQNDEEVQDVTGVYELVAAHFGEKTSTTRKWLRRKNPYFEGSASGRRDKLFELRDASLHAWLAGSQPS
jgi:hypothetical protein